ncbi:TPA: hypothetical protein ACG4N3_002803 [Stenotrophomonas maltophilia]|nr:MULTISPECIES: hypothetical protein [Stenotrophomonas]EKT4105928.1 hypothetical protein [Stenotrophomonas maltophilia]MBN5076936.1 hypothetical protein [Stenotrophomonas maltophilia]MCU1182311.1 hypothetical protein [Stenotrophomonas maltophilia]MCU1206411.1 hypothetical protein [Stenotrophomonas maltophilia]MDQ7307858.1 hypothetical protein [Stenotrophomonas sp. Sm3119]
MKPQGKRRICMLAGLLVLLATACRPDAARDAGSIAEAHRPDLVPLVRAMPTTAMDAPLTVEFDVAAPSKNSSPTLMIGIRVDRTDNTAALGALADVRASGFQAKVSMQRLESSGWTDVPLLRLESIIGEPARTIPIPADGRVTSAWLDDADVLALQNAGLERPGNTYAQLAFAWARNPSPGRYRIEVQLHSPLTQLDPYHPELLIAYLRRPK